jgi:microcompartment protein CcmL/EutN
LTESLRDTIGVVELNSIAAGFQTADEMVKVAPVSLLEAAPVCPGKFVILVAGDVASVDASVKKGLETGGAFVVDQLFLPYIDPGVFPALLGTSDVKKIEAIGVIETFSVAATIVAADRAAKTAKVRLIEIRVAKGLGGKGYVTFTGEVGDVESSVRAGEEAAKERGLLVKGIVIPRPHESFSARIL